MAAKDVSQQRVADGVKNGGSGAFKDWRDDPKNSGTPDDDDDDRPRLRIPSNTTQFLTRTSTWPR